MCGIVGFQGDFTFDERIVTFQSPPVQKAGLTGGNWNVSGNVLPGAGPIRTLRISAYSNDLTPLSGSGTLFELRMTRVSKADQSTQLLWAAPPDNFIFIDTDQRPAGREDRGGASEVLRLEVPDRGACRVRARDQHARPVRLPGPAHGARRPARRGSPERCQGRCW